MFMKKKKTQAVLAGVLIVVMLLTVSPVLLQATEAEVSEGFPVGYAENYTVQPGDTLWGLAQERGLDQGLLAAANDLPEDTLLLAGQELLIPKGNVVPHVIALGETLWAIAGLYNTDVNSIISENDLDNPDALLAGDEILVPVNAGHAYAGIAPARHAYAATAPARHKWMLPFWPTFGVVSSVFGPRDGRQHEGIDIAAEEGTPIRAVKSGRVVFAGERGAYGNAVIIDHGRGLRTLYAHASEVTVEKGEVVEEGQEVALVGNTGRSTGPHLHFELLYQGTPLNPARYLPRKD
jgi:murein DD-endopeptidase MepM/ murein hydrolase activator NlpD